jgi:hypothetical protein
VFVFLLQALYRGNGANVARLIPDVAFKFAVHDQFKLMFAPQDGSPPGVQEKMAAGAATGGRLQQTLIINRPQPAAGVIAGCTCNQHTAAGVKLDYGSVP